MCNPDACGHCRVAEKGWPAGEVVEESDSRTKKNRPNVDGEFIEESSIQQLLDNVRPMDANRLSASGGFGLAHGAFDAVSHEVDR
ncbi:hypothetical protein TVNIR_3514 [Thioalkalivibrio nitratireducens DSM 14787]|uniref:Uncharacterized protein n=1 Tax=Thioalkalivibrio nitratireducens (strain DSM 14787 / UNIQEM 213 / ALEN2) TaxID=1255043 RepID=L0E1M8_THIND|nr:hypothetical protein TVNIR_3514 [Thioalkalivibrio nitratireducens DSM 14787]